MKDAKPETSTDAAAFRLVAAATADGVTLLTHGGRVRGFALYRIGADTIDSCGRATPAGRIELPADEELHLCGDGRPHAIDAVAAVIVGPSGEGFVKHMRRRGIEAVTTTREDVAAALADYMAGMIEPAEPPPHPHEHHDPAS